MKVGELKVSEQLREQLEKLGEEWEVRQDEDVVTLTYMDAYEIVEVTLELNEYGNVVSVCYEYASFDEEIIMSSSCHDCSEYCEYYNALTEECSITEEDIDNEIAKWVDVPKFENRDFEIMRIVKDVECYLNIPHIHSYRGYLINFKTANNISFMDILNTLEYIIGFYETYVEELKKHEDN